jgi:hypothetical protein
VSLGVFVLRHTSADEFILLPQNKKTLSSLHSVATLPRVCFAATPEKHFPHWFLAFVHMMVYGDCG